MRLILALLMVQNQSIISCATIDRVIMNWQLRVSNWTPLPWQVQHPHSVFLPHSGFKENQYIPWQFLESDNYSKIIPGYVNNHYPKEGEVQEEKSKGKHSGAHYELVNV